MGTPWSVLYMQVVVSPHLAVMFFLKYCMPLYILVCDAGKEIQYKAAWALAFAEDNVIFHILQAQGRCLGVQSCRNHVGYCCRSKFPLLTLPC